MNNIQYDKSLNLLQGQYSENFDIDKFNEIVTNIINANNRTNIIELIGEGIEEISSNNKSLSNNLHLFSNIIGKMGEVNKNISYYNTKAIPWIAAIKKHEGNKKLALLEGYFKMTSEYINLDLKNVNVSEENTLCSDCDSIIDKEEEVCNICGAVQTKFISGNSFNYFESISAPKTPKTTLNKFWEKYLRFQGRLDININISDIERIKKYISDNYSISSTSEEYRSANLSLMREALITLSLGRYKDDINVLLNIVWNYKIPNYKDYDTEIESNWVRGNEIILANKQDDELQNITHNEWRLYRELKDVGIKCDPDDFQITNNKDIKRKMESLWKIRCKELGKTYKPL